MLQNNLNKSINIGANEDYLLVSNIAVTACVIVDMLLVSLRFLGGVAMKLSFYLL